jgi:hypothetical protein
MANKGQKFKLYDLAFNMKFLKEYIAEKHEIPSNTIVI